MTDPRPYSAPYDMRCPIARTLDIVGERWTILILRDLVTGGPRKFYEQHPPRAEYVLTEKGKELRPVLRTLFDWGQRHTRYGRPDR